MALYQQLEPTAEDVLEGLEAVLHEFDDLPPEAIIKQDLLHISRNSVVTCG